jgi:hypothetical protein
MTCFLEPLVRTPESEQPSPAATIVIRIGFPFTETDGGDVTKDDANYPHACLCKNGGCALKAGCPCFHFGIPFWAR